MVRWYWGTCKSKCSNWFFLGCDFAIVIYHLANLIFLFCAIINYSGTLIYHRFRWYATLEDKTHAQTFSNFLSVLHVINRLDQNLPITATSVTFWPSLHHASGLWLVDFDLICWLHVRLTEILETFLWVFCFPKSCIKENGGNKGPRDWQYVLAIMRFCCIKVLFHILYHYWGQEIVPFTKDCIM